MAESIITRALTSSARTAVAPGTRRLKRTCPAVAGLRGWTASGVKHPAKVTTDHDEIRSWAERQGGKPAAVARTHSDEDVGIIRIMFPDAPNSEHAALTEITWDGFFEEFDSHNLALLQQEDGLFSKIIGRDTAEKRAKGDHDAAR